MKVVIRRLGNSQGAIIPKPILAQVGLVAVAEMRVEKGAIVLERPADTPRTGWAEASKRLAGRGDDALVWPDFENESDKDIKW